MTSYAITPPATPSLAIAGSNERFPIRRVFCVARNYAAHAREMGANPDREPPFFFTKPADAVVPAAGVVPHPPASKDMHHEVEMVVAIGKAGANVDPSDALSLVWGYGAGLDLTCRDLQAAAKEAGRPWDFAKGFDASGPCSELHPVSEVGHPNNARVWVEVNGVVKQDGNLDEMIWKVPEVIAAISRYVALQPGDLIFSGTPAGVGPLVPGDRVRGGVDGVAGFQLEIGPPN
ncbi:MAG: fumarylacetoacetate hydrolase family protein [Ramlibacter sp.]